MLQIVPSPHMNGRPVRQSEHVLVSVGDRGPHFRPGLEVLADEGCNLRDGLEILEIQETEILAIDRTQIGKQFFRH